MRDRAVPAVDEVARSFVGAVPHTLAVRLVREAIKSVRLGISQARVEELASDLIDGVRRARPAAVINGSGVLLHTNLGRSRLSGLAASEMKTAALGYGNVELDLNSGERGSRGRFVEEVLCALVEAEAALVVNNNAAAVFLTLAVLAQGTNGAGVARRVD